jgi:hypothetical protein
MKTSTRTARQTAAALVVAALALTSSAAAAQAAGSATAEMPAAAGLAASQHKAPSAKTKNGHSRIRAGKRPTRAQTRSEPRDIVIVGGSAVSFSEFKGCFGPFAHSWGYSRTCVWDGEDIFGSVLTRQFHYQYWNGFTYRPWYTVECDAWTCHQI